MAPATDTDLQEAVAAECQALAEVLSGLPSPSWDAPSLCAGWRVREVIAHLTMPARYSTPRFLAELVRARGNFHRMADRSARRDAALPTDDFVAALRGPRLQAWKPPGGGHQGALVHATIHGLDATTPLDLGRRVPEDRLRIVLAAITRPSSLRYFGVDLSGVELRADDMGWSHGSGAPLSGAGQDLALLLCGRTLPAGRLHGEPSGRFSGLRA
jgi:uncharacterized protein (TIGR03083 family)